MESNLDKHIVLIGFMGSGKSTVGSILTDMLDIPFVDMDDQIEHFEGTTIQEIFDQKGEDHFRKLEQQVLKTVLRSKKKHIISTGGGTPCFFNNLELIKQESISFYLHVGVHELANRLKDDTQRPLLKERSGHLINLIKEKLNLRRPFYEQATYKLRGVDPANALAVRISNRIKGRK